jgi:RNA polymerase sigma-70 factor, ECF subfamily
MDSKQFKAQILELKDKMYRFADSILCNSDAAMDAVQDLNLKLWEKRDQLGDVENIRAFVYKSMRNLCLDKLRQKKQFTEISNEVFYDEPDPHQHTENRDMVAKVKMVIEKLPELQRTIIRMRDVDGMEIGEISFALSITENAVSVNLSRARQKVREQILKEQKMIEAYE